MLARSCRLKAAIRGQCAEKQPYAGCFTLTGNLFNNWHNAPCIPGSARSAAPL